MRCKKIKRWIKIYRYIFIHLTILNYYCVCTGQNRVTWMMDACRRVTWAHARHYRPTIPKQKKIIHLQLLSLSIMQWYWSRCEWTLYQLLEITLPELLIFKNLIRSFVKLTIQHFNFWQFVSYVLWNLTLNTDNTDLFQVTICLKF